MTILPTQVNILGVLINTFGLFLALGFLLIAFVVWYEGRQDKFSEEKMFDLLLLSTAVGVVTARVFYAVANKFLFFHAVRHIFVVWEPGYSMIGAIIGAFVFLLYMCNKLKWSIYRILDIFGLALALGLSMVMLGFVGLQGRFELLFAFSAWLLMYAVFSKYRNKKIKSGYTFSLIILLSTFLDLVFFGKEHSLIFYVVLVTLGAVVFLLRWRLTNQDEKLAERLTGILKRITNKKRRTA